LAIRSTTHIKKSLVYIDQPGLQHSKLFAMAASSPPPYFTDTPDLWIPIPNTPQRLALSWEHTRAIQRLGRFFARLYARTQNSEDKTGLEKYRSWMITLFQMNASIHEGTYSSRTWTLMDRTSTAERCGQYMSLHHIRRCSGGFSRGARRGKHIDYPRHELHSRVQGYQHSHARN
jgi:hypothetical protein